MILAVEGGRVRTQACLSCQWGSERLNMWFKASFRACLTLSYRFPLSHGDSSLPEGAGGGGGRGRLRLNLPAATVQLFQLYTKGCPVQLRGSLGHLIPSSSPENPSHSCLQTGPPRIKLKRVGPASGLLPCSFPCHPSLMGAGLIHDWPPLKMGPIPFDFPCQGKDRLGLGRELF